MTTTPTRPTGRAARRGEQAWTGKDLDELRRRLQEDVERMTRQIAATRVTIADPMSPHGAEGADDSMAFATHATALDQQLDTLDNRTAVLEQTRRALRRLAEGSYPDCLVCSRPVGKARQQAIPRAVMCLRCQARHDRLERAS